MRDSHRGRSASMWGSPPESEISRLQDTAVQKSRGTSSFSAIAAASLGSAKSRLWNPGWATSRPLMPYSFARWRRRLARSLPAAARSGSFSATASCQTNAVAYCVNPRLREPSSSLCPGSWERRYSSAFSAKGTASRTSSGSSSAAKMCPPDDMTFATRWTM